MAQTRHAPRSCYRGGPFFPDTCCGHRFELNIPGRPPELDKSQAGPATVASRSLKRSIGDSDAIDDDRDALDECQTEMVSMEPDRQAVRWGLSLVQLRDPSSITIQENEGSDRGAGKQ